MTGTTSSRWCLEATSGTTPPYGACSSACEAITLLLMWPSAVMTAAAVSSHDVSIPRITRAWLGRPLGADLDAGPLKPASVRGALLAVGEMGTSVIRTSDPDESSRGIGAKRARALSQTPAQRQAPPIARVSARQSPST